jgi:hypothetical protein
MPAYSIDEAKEDISRIQEGDSLFFKDKYGRVRKGTIRLKAVWCNKKGCTKCPHKIYAYAQYRDGKKVTEKYVGVARKN